MSKTWLLRGGMAVVLAVLVGAWTMGVAGIGGKASPQQKISDQAPSDSASVTSSPSPVDADAITPPRPPATSAPASSAAPTLEPTPDAVEPVADSPTTKATRKPKKRNPSPSPPQPGKSTKPPTSPSPTPPPSQPVNDCNGVIKLVDCLLAPITDRP